MRAISARAFASSARSGGPRRGRSLESRRAWPGRSSCPRPRGPAASRCGPSDFGRGERGETVVEVSVHVEVALEEEGGLFGSGQVSGLPQRREAVAQSLSASSPQTASVVAGGGGGAVVVVAAVVPRPVPSGAAHGRHTHPDAHQAEHGDGEENAQAKQDRIVYLSAGSNGFCFEKGRGFPRLSMSRARCLSRTCHDVGRGTHLPVLRLTNGRVDTVGSGVLRTTRMFLMPASYEACRYVSVIPE